MQSKLTHVWSAEGVARNGTSPHGVACRSELACGRLRINEELWSQGQKRKKTNKTEAKIQDGCFVRFCDYTHNSIQCYYSIIAIVL